MDGLEDFIPGSKQSDVMWWRYDLVGQELHFFNPLPFFKYGAILRELQLEKGLHWKGSLFLALLWGRAI